MTAPIPFPTGIARDMARVRILAADLQRLITDLDHYTVITPTAHARIGNLIHDAALKTCDLAKALATMDETNANRMQGCSAPLTGLSFESLAELTGHVRRLAADFDGPAGAA
jgi:hypothetical protein